MKFKFEKLIVWQKAMDLAEKVHLLRKSFSEDEKFNLSSQILRAADSIALHISEGSIGRTNLDFTRYLGYSVGSLSEVVSCLHKADRCGYINKHEFDANYEACIELMNSLIAFKRNLK